MLGLIAFAVTWLAACGQMDASRDSDTPKRRDNVFGNGTTHDHDEPSSAGKMHKKPVSTQRDTSNEADAAADITPPEPTCKQAAVALALAETTPTYEGTIKSLMDTKCAYCHSAAAPAAMRETPYLTTLDLVQAAAPQSLRLMQMGSNKPMPPRQATPQLAAGELASFQAWMDAGYPVGTPPPPVDPSKGIYYVAPIKSVLDQACVPCHKVGGTPPDLATYEAAVAGAPRSLVRIRAKTMPPAGPLTEDVIGAFATWVDAKTPYAEGTPPPPPQPQPDLPSEPARPQGDGDTPVVFPEPACAP